MPPRSIDVLFSDFAPDRGGAPWPENPGYLIDATNVRFTPNGYRSTYIDANATVTPVAVGATPISACGFANITTPRHYAGTAAKIYESADYGASWFDNAGAAYSAVDWEFAIFGTKIIAVNGNDNPQVKDLGDAVATNFANLGGTPPKAVHVARVRDSLVLGQTDTDSYGLRWSSIGDPADWPTPGSATALARQAGSYSLQSDYGLVQQIIGGEKFGVVFQERALTRMTYVGGDIQFTFDVYDKGRGTGYVRSAIRVGNLIYFLSSVGIFVTDGYTVTPISLGKVDDAFVFKLLTDPHGPSSFYKGVAYDSRTKCVCWLFLNVDTTTCLLCYDLVLQQFKIVKHGALALDGTLYSVINSASINNQFSVPHYIDTNLHLRQFSNITGVATLLRTGFVELEPGAVTEIAGIRVIGAANSASPVIAVRSAYDTVDINLLDSGVGAYTPAVKSPTTDLFRVRQSGRYHSFSYAESAQAQATLIRGLRVYYEIKSQQ